MFLNFDVGTCFFILLTIFKEKLSSDHDEIVDLDGKLLSLVKGNRNDEVTLCESESLKETTLGKIL